jgi:hypothetical protein
MHYQEHLLLGEGKMKKRLVLALVVLALAFSATAAFADTIEFTGIGVAWGWNGPANTNGSTITASSPLVIVSPPPLIMPGSALNFTTGLFSGGSFLAGGSVVVTDTTPSFCGGNCFTGTFTGVQTLSASGNFSADFISGTVAPNLWAALGFPAGPNGATGHLVGTLNLNTTTGSLDLTLNRVPEPTSLAILGTAFLLGGATLRRKFAL